MAKVSVDLDRCQGIGMCEMTAPNVFEVTEESQARVLVDEVDPADLPAVNAAVDGCPTAALTLHE